MSSQVRYAVNCSSPRTRIATRGGAPAIDLIDGDLLVDKLKELGLGVSTKIVRVEQVTVDADWFRSI